MIRPDFTFTGGPTPISAATAAGLGAPVVSHTDPFFTDEFQALQGQIAEILGTGNDIVLMQGEAVLGLEAAARALVQPGTVALNLASGVYGKGMGHWLRAFGARVVELEVSSREIVTAQQVEEALDEHPDVELVTVVHCETPSGTLNPVAEIGPIAKRHGALTIADCASSFAGMPLRPDEWSLDVCVAAPQKCLAGPPGLSILSVSQDAWRAMEANPSAPRSSYLSLLDWKSTWIGDGSFPYTPSVAEVHGIAAACSEYLAEGVEAAFARHALAATACRAGVRAMGLELWPASDDISASCVTVVDLPDGVTGAQLRDHVRERYGVMLSDGEGTSDRILRIGHMGVMSRSLYPVVGLMALARGAADLGLRVDVGAGAAAALGVLAEGAMTAAPSGSGA